VTVPRVELLTAATAPLSARRYYAGGDPGPIVAALAQVPEVLEAALPFLSVALGPTAISMRHKEIVVLRTSALLECRYCIDTHSVVALDTPLTRDEVRTLRGELAAEWVDPAEAALLAWVDAVAGAAGPVPDALGRTLGEYFADHEVVELTLLIGAIMMLNRFCTALELPTAAAVVDRLRTEGLS